MSTRKYSYLRCPVCKNRLSLPGLDSLKCLSCKKAYEIRSSIPIVVDKKNIESEAVSFFDNFNKTLNPINFKIYFRRRWDKITKHTNVLELSSKNKLLEIGSGEGNMIKMIQKKIKAEIIGLDYSFKLCQTSKTKLGDKVKIINGDASLLPFSDNYFNLVYSNALLHHVKKQKMVITESVRVCKDSGFVIFIEPNRFHPIQIAYGILEKSERGTLKFSCKKIVEYLNLTKRVEQTKVVPLNTFIYSYRKFLPGFLLSIVEKIEPVFDSKFVSTHFVIIAKIKK